VSVRWCPLLSAHSPQAFLEVLHHSLEHAGRNCCHFFPDVLFQIHHCPWFLFVHLALEISSEEEVLWLGTLVPMNIELPMKYPLSQDRIVVSEIHLHSKSPMLYRPALHGNWNALSLATRSVLKDKFPMPTVPLRTVLPNHHVFLLDPVYDYRGKFSSPLILVVNKMWHTKSDHTYSLWHTCRNIRSEKSWAF